MAMLTSYIEAINMRESQEREEKEAMKRPRNEDGIEEVKDGWSEIKMAAEELSLKHGEEKQEMTTMAFLAVSNLLLQVLDKIGPTMAVLRLDVCRNIQRLEELYVLDPLAYSSLISILRKEMSEGTTRKSESCSRAIVWLTRSIDFGVALMARVDKDSESTIEQVVEEAYATTLKPWHGWISTAAYKVAVKLIPERKNFIRLLMGKGQDNKMLKVDIENLMSLIQPFLNELHAQLKEFRLDRLKSP